MPVLIKYFSVALCSIYVYVRIYDISFPKSFGTIFGCLLLSSLLSVLMVLMRANFTAVRTIIMVFISTCFNIKLFQININKTISGTIIAFGISYAAFSCSALLVGSLKCILLQYTQYRALKTLEMMFLSVIQLLLIFLVFRIKRYKHGLRFLQDKGASDIGVYICISLLLLTSFLSTKEDFSKSDALPGFLILILLLFLLFWWRSRTTKEYMNRLKAKEIEEMQRTLLQKDEKIAALQCENEALAKIIHRDNKLIPAMELLVREFLLSAKATTDTQVLSARADEILLQLADASKERAGIIQTYELQNKKLPATNVPSVDALLAYMLQRSIAGKIDLEVSIEGSFRHLIDQELSELELNTLLSDLIENAMIAVGGCERKSVLICIGVIGGTYFIDIYDSGPPFQPEVLQKIGQEPITTHAESGGSGIGLMTTVGLCRKNLISLEIEEFSDQTLYTKRVRLCFDHLGQIRVPSDSGFAVK